MATIKVKSMPDFYTLAIVLINKYKETCEEQILFFDLIGGPKLPLNARIPLIVHKNSLFNISPRKFGMLCNYLQVSKKYHYRVSNSLDPYQARQNVRPNHDQGPNCTKG